MPSRFLQIHTLTSYPAALLNRDDAGFAKQLPFGSAVRTRISSQCLKRHWRTFEGEHSLRSIGEGMSVRSRHIFDQLVLTKLLEDGMEEGEAKKAVKAVMKEALGESAKAKAANESASAGEEDAEGAKPKNSQADDAGGELQTGQIVVLGKKEIDHLTGLARRIAEGEEAKKVLSKEERKNLKALEVGAGLDAAVFGRMVTSDILARCDAAVHVAHAFTVHAAQTEADYFSAVDDLTADEGELGAGHINSTDLTSGLYYGYVAVDVPLLVSNLTGCDLREDRNAWKQADRSLAGQVVEALVHTIATVSPGAKLGSTAPHSLAHLVLVEAGDAQPCTFANAFVDPVRTRGDLIADAYAALAQELYDLDQNYPRDVARAHLARGKDERYARLKTEQTQASLAGEEGEGGRKGVPGDTGERKNLPGLASWAAGRVTE